MAPNAKIVDLFLFILPLWLLITLTKHTNNYATWDYVRQVGAKDQNGKVRKEKWLVPCERDDKGARHRATSDYGWVSACMDWNTDCDWSIQAPKGSPDMDGCPVWYWVSWIQNSMPRDRFENTGEFFSLPSCKPKDTRAGLHLGN
jgi:hypothetical protein